MQTKERNWMALPQTPVKSKPPKAIHLPGETKSLKKIVLSLLNSKNRLPDIYLRCMSSPQGRNY